MKRLGVLGFILLSNVACGAQSAPAPDTTEVEAAVRRFYGYIASYDYAALRDASTQDFEILEAGLRMNFEEFESMLRGMQASGVELAFDLSEFNTEGSADVAYTSNRMKSGSGTVYLESFILQRSGDRWLIDRATSTQARQNDP